VLEVAARKRFIPAIDIMPLSVLGSYCCVFLTEGIKTEETPEKQIRLETLSVKRLSGFGGMQVDILPICLE
jgi:hypothetical protein